MDYQGQRNAAWSNHRYPEYVTDRDKAYSFLVESGDLAFPIADFAQRVVSDPTLHGVVHKSRDGRERPYLAIAQDYVKRVEETVAYHHARWHTDIINNSNGSFQIGFYSSEPGATFLVGIAPQKPLPTNYQTSMGRVLAMLWLATKNTSYRDRAIALGNFLLLEFQYKRNGSYWWTYWPRMSYYRKGYVENFGNARPEDISHASLSVQFAYLMYRHEIGVFYDTEMQRLARTFRLNISCANKGDTYCRYVDGTGGSAREGDRYLMGAYLPLSAVERGQEKRIYSIAHATLIKALLIDQPGKIGGASGLLSLANLILYWRPDYADLAPH